MTLPYRIAVLWLWVLAGASIHAQAPSGFAHHEISGIVVSAKSGEPLADTSIIAIQSNIRKAVSETSTDASGRFQFEDLPDGKYDLVASRKGYVTSAYQQHEGGINTAIVTGDGLISTGLLFQLDPLARIFGTIQEDSGDPVPGAQVKLFQRDTFRGAGRMMLIRNGNADAMGNFEIGGLSPGKYILCVVGTPWYAVPKRSFLGSMTSAENGLSRLDVVYSPTCYPNANDPAEAEFITVGSGEQVPLNITMHPVPAIHISFQVPASEDNNSPMITPSQVNTKILGNSEFIPAPISINRNNPNTPYVVDVEVPPGQYEISFSGQNGDAGRHIQIDTDSESSVRMPTASDPDPVVTGILRAESGEPLAENTTVWLEARDSDARSAAQVSPDGTFTMQPVRAGVYRVASSSMGNAMGIARLSAKGAQVRGHLLTLSGEPAQLNIVVRQSSARVNGIVKKQGVPSGGVFVLLVPTGPQQTGDHPTANQSDSDGTFNYVRVPPGEYTVVAIVDGWKLDWGKVETIKPYLAHGESMRVEPQTREINLKDPLEPQPLELR